MGAAGIIALITAVFAAIPIFYKWFKTSGAQAVEDKQDDVLDEHRKAKQSGRPKW
jgi:hypothetical protein